MKNIPQIEIYLFGESVPIIIKNVKEGFTFLIIVTDKESVDYSILGSSVQ